MPGSTPTYGLPYQSLGDAPHGPNLGQDLADAVEAQLVRVDTDVADLTRLQYAYTTASLTTPLSGAWGNVTGFTFAAVAGKVYGIDCALFIENFGSSGVDIKFGWSWTGVGAMTSSMSGVDVNAAGAAYNGPNTAHAILNDTTSPLDEPTGLGLTAAVPLISRVAATYVCTNAGTVQLRFAQVTSDATWVSRVQHGSRMRVERLN